MREGYKIPFTHDPPLTSYPKVHTHCPNSSASGTALMEEITSLIAKGAIEEAPHDQGFYSRLFVVRKTSGSWRPVIDLSSLNAFINKTQFRMETVQSVLSSVRLGDWMVSIDLQDAYFQIPIHKDSRKYLRFVSPLGT